MVLLETIDLQSLIVVVLYNLYSLYSWLGFKVPCNVNSTKSYWGRLRLDIRWHLCQREPLRTVQNTSRDTKLVCKLVRVMPNRNVSVQQQPQYRKVWEGLKIYTYSLTVRNQYKLTHGYIPWISIDVVPQRLNSKQIDKNSRYDNLTWHILIQERAGELGEMCKLFLMWRLKSWNYEDINKYCMAQIISI